MELVVFILLGILGLVVSVDVFWYVGLFFDFKWMMGIFVIVIVVFFFIGGCVVGWCF